MTDDFLRARLDQMIDLPHPLAVLARRIQWAQLEVALAPSFEWRDCAGRLVAVDDLFGPSLQTAGAGVSVAGRPRLPIRLMASLLYLKHTFDLSDEAVVGECGVAVLQWPRVLRTPAAVRCHARRPVPESDR